MDLKPPMDGSVIVDRRPSDPSPACSASVTDPELRPHTHSHTHTQRQYEHVFNTTQCVCV